MPISISLAKYSWGVVGGGKKTRTVNVRVWKLQKESGGGSRQREGECYHDPSIISNKSFSPDLSENLLVDGEDLTGRLMISLSKRPYGLNNPVSPESSKPSPFRTQDMLS